MKISESWLREFVNPDITSSQMCDQLTLAGLEVDAIEKVASDFSGVVVGEIIEINPHPNADKLRLCKVNIGPEILNIVCGASNIYVGMKAPVATIGAVLPGDFKIKKSKLRGESSYGMMCSEKELGLSDGQEGLFDLPRELTIGEDIRAALNLDDISIDIDLTPNRADCLSVIGIAREVSTLNAINISIPPISKIPNQNTQKIDIDIQHPEHCPKYCARIISGINPDVKTPLWMLEKIRRSGLRSISLTVDVTNYLLLKYGQPMHAFDLAKIDEKVIVRQAQQGESIILLDESTVKLKKDTLVIADASKPIALAGVMGGLETSVSNSTTDILLESAFFSPKHIAGKARYYGLHTDSSHRFERGVDPALCEQIIEEATQLIIDIAGGSPGPVCVKKYEEHISTQPKIQLSLEKISKVLGFKLSEKFVVETLTNLGLSVLEIAPETWEVQAPSYRFDINIEEDLIEELVRIYGYQHIPESIPAIPAEGISISEKIISINVAKTYFVNRGYHEAINYSFIDKNLDNLFFSSDGYELTNPIASDMSVMRQSLLPGLLLSLKENLSRRQSRIKLFEIGRIFIKHKNKVEEKNYISGVALGYQSPLNWKDNKELDFFDIKGDLEQFLNIEQLEFKALKNCEYLHPGQSASILVNGEDIGIIGVIHPAILKHMQIKSKAPIVFEIDYESICHKEIPKFQSISKYPPISRDLALIVDESISVDEIICITKQSLSNINHEINVFDVYSGENLPKNKKSVALNLILQSSSKTLIDEDIKLITDSIVSKLSNDIGAVLRE